MKLYYLLLFIGLLGCDKDQTVPFYDGGNPKQINYLALGDSYTIGQSVCTTCRFPEQLKRSIQAMYPNNPFLLQVIARTGWTTSGLISEINLVNPSTNFDLVTLLIGVNNQYQNRPFSVYESEFPTLVNRAITLARGDKSNVIVVSIPDYAYTPFGQGAANISAGIDQYNAFAENYCRDNEITFVNITDITRLGLLQPELVASDGLHPSELAYSKFVERIVPKALLSLEN
jgi:lysophospholipase L1-like esterase